MSTVSSQLPEVNYARGLEIAVDDGIERDAQRAAKSTAGSTTISSSQSSEAQKREVGDKLGARRRSLGSLSRRTWILAIGLALILIIVIVIGAVVGIRTHQSR